MSGPYIVWYRNRYIDYWTRRAGVIPISRNMDTVGAFGRTVADAVHGLNAIASSDEEDPATHIRSNEKHDFSKLLASRSDLKGVKFGFPWKRCWDSVAQQKKDVALRLFEAIEEAGAEIHRTDFPCAQDRIEPDGSWNWKRGAATESEFTVVKTDAYNDINAYIYQLSESSVRSMEDLLAFIEKNTGTEGAESGVVPAFPSGQDNLQKIVDHGGKEDDTYHKALEYTRHQCRNQGIDAALKRIDEDGSYVGEFDALLLCDRKGAGQQLAAQAGYPIICIPIGLDTDGFPVSLSLQHKAWREGTLIKWASAIEDVVHHLLGWRPTPEYKNLYSKNIPVNPLP